MCMYTQTSLFCQLRGQRSDIAIVMLRYPDLGFVCVCVCVCVCRSVMSDSLRSHGSYPPGRKKRTTEISPCSSHHTKAKLINSLLCPWNSPGKNTGVGSWLFPSPGDLPDPGIKPRSPALQADSLLSEPPGKPMLFSNKTKQGCLEKQLILWLG